ncbi:uncharacterized protein LOC143860226 [Tasmannia lanceolata]|uniref:uncharacterized protein LOC143860226 n=1 Tax=Tasmannia lanceolata TaxID=3420 RepID=UPI004062A480
MGPISLIRNGIFRKEGADFPFCGFAEPWTDDVTGQRFPGFEIFFNLELSEAPMSAQITEAAPKTDWADVLEPGCLNGMFQIEYPVAAVVGSETEASEVAVIGRDAFILNPAELITPAKGPLTNWTSQQDSGSKKERPVYYISKKMLEYEVKYTILEKTCLALVWATQRLRHYLLSSKVLLLSRMDPLKYLFEKPALTGRTARWLLLLSEFNITYVTQKSVKGRVIAEQLADSPVEENAFLKAEFPDEEIMDVEEDTPNTRWAMYFDGAVNNQGQGIGATNGKWKTREDRLIPYNAYLESLVQKFRSITFTHLYRTKNHFADALATLASMLDISATMEVQPLTVRLQWEPAHVNVIEIAARCPDGKPWYTDIKNLISGEGHPLGASGKERKTLQKLAANFVICGDQLYRRSFDGIQLLCVDEDKAVELIEQTHA